MYVDQLRVEDIRKQVKSSAATCRYTFPVHIPDCNDTWPQGTPGLRSSSQHSTARGHGIRGRPLSCTSSQHAVPHINTLGHGC